MILVIMVSIIFALLLIPIHLMGQYLLGKVLITKLGLFSSPQNLNVVPITWLLGLLIYLLLVLTLSSLGIALEASSLMPYLVIFLYSKSAIIKVFTEFKSNLKPLSWNYSIWLIVTILIGLSIFSAADGNISTPWRNNYGDLAFHLGMISSFTFDHNSPPQYHILAGETLSYPFLINLWSATLWVYGPEWNFLSLIFFLQWFLLWQVVYACFSGDKSWPFPWLILLAGGTYFTLLDNSGTKITEGMVWTSLLTTIWITQRASILGLAVSVVILNLFIKWQKSSSRSTDRNLLLLAGVFVGISPLAHIHLLMAPTAFIGLYLITNLYQLTKDSLKDLLAFVLPLFLAFHALPFLLTKHSLVSIKPGHLFGDQFNISSDFFILLLKNFTPLIIFFLVFWLVSRQHRPFLIMIFLAIFFWNIKLSIWGWDQVKVFISLYVVLIAIWYQYSDSITRWIFIFFPLLIAPTLAEVGFELYKGDKLVLFSKADIAQGYKLRKIVPPGESVFAAPDHNSPAALSGRPVFIGYDGWLWSHGLNFNPQKAYLDNIELLPETCEDKNCPGYMLWTERESRYFKKAPESITWLEHIEDQVYKIRYHNRDLNKQLKVKIKR